VLSACATLDVVTVHRIKFAGPAGLAVPIATALADADGVDLTASAPPAIIDEETVSLDLTVEGTDNDVAEALADIRRDLPDGASIDIVD